MSKILVKRSDCPPEDERSLHLAGLRAVASLEMFKGLLVLAAGFGLIVLRHTDFGDLAERLIEHLHLNPTHHVEQIFISAANRFSDRKILAIAIGAFVYTVLRFVEAYGLWNAKVWAEWFAIISGGLYLPLEILGVARHDDRLRWAVLVINIFVVLYMIYVRWDTLKQERRERQERWTRQVREARL
jgi:uncharacterized membrane protein (DUF2068 family)